MEDMGNDICTCALEVTGQEKKSCLLGVYGLREIVYVGWGVCGVVEEETCVDTPMNSSFTWLGQ
jgi:hypothetical protein